jgi:hypothetical protein
MHSHPHPPIPLREYKLPIGSDQNKPRYYPISAKFVMLAAWCVEIIRRPISSIGFDPREHLGLELL